MTKINVCWMGCPWLSALFLFPLCAFGAAPSAEWASPYDGPCINTHMHLINPDPDILRADLRTCKERRIVNLLIARENDIELVRAMMKEFPGHAYGLGWVDPDSERALEMVEAYRKAGFVGLKFGGSNLAYNDAAYLPVFEKAAEFGLPCVFHTTTTGSDLRNHPVRVDSLQRGVKGLKVIAYHLANPNFEVAGELMLKNKNMYFDMSGITSRMVEQHYLGAVVGREMLLNKFRDALWHEQMWSQVVFGVDGLFGAKPKPGALRAQSQAEGPAPTSWYGADRVLRYKDYYRDWMTALKVPEAIQYKVMYDNAARLFGLPRRPGAATEEPSPAKAEE